jgi:GDP-L-fucose synthase
MNKISKHSRIFIAGHKGLVGSALVRVFKSRGYQNLILKDRTDCDLEKIQDVERLFKQEKPEVVIVAAAKVGGILANNTFPYDFIEKNLKIELNLIGESHRRGVEHLVFLGSSCIYPKMAPQPIQEESLLTGPLESTNRPYALAKIAGIEMCWALNRQFGRRYFSVMPTNLYGPEDNFDLQTSHVLPALIRKFHDAHRSGAREVEVWGTGTPRREFLYSDDLAEAILFLLESESEKLNFLFSEERAPLINVGFSEDLTIRELAELIGRIVGYSGHIKFDRSKPDGTPRKLMDSSKILALGWKPKVGLEQGILRVYESHFGVDKTS